MFSGADIVVPIAVALFCLGVVYQAGRLSNRVDALEEWRRETKQTLDSIHAILREISTAVRHEST